MMAVIRKTVIALISYLCSQFHSECIQIYTISHIDAISLAKDAPNISLCVIFHVQSFLRFFQMRVSCPTSSPESGCKCHIYIKLHV